MIIAIDFDGTCVTHEFPGVGRDIGAEPVLRELVENGHGLVLFTMRSDKTEPEWMGQCMYLTEAVNWFKDRDIPLWGIQSNPEQLSWTTSPKAYAQLYIDDAALGCPLLYPGGMDRPFVDWDEVRKMLVNMGIIVSAESGE